MRKSRKVLDIASEDFSEEEIIMVIVVVLHLLIDQDLAQEWINLNIK